MQKCQKNLVGGVDIFCGNFCTRRGQLPPFQMMWCAGFYKEHGNDKFPRGVDRQEGSGKRKLKRFMREELVDITC